VTSVTGVRVRRPLPGLLLGVLLLGIAESMAGPYLVLFGADRAHLSPFAIGVLVSVMAVTGMAVSTWLGRRYDRAPSRVPVLVAIAASCLGYGLLTRTTSYALLLVIAAVFLGTGIAAFPQLFALARGQLDGLAAGASARATPALRSVFSLAWAIGPVVGAAILAWQGFAGLFLGTSVVFGLVALPVLLLDPPRAVSHTSTVTADANVVVPADPAGPLLPTVLSFGLFYTAMFSGSVALPLYVTGVLDRSDSDVGLLFSVCALVEVPAALALMLLPARVGRKRVIQFGMVLFVVYFAAVTASANFLVLVLAQVVRGVAISVVGALGITYFQDLRPDGAGRATTLVANTTTAGSLVAGLVAGATAQAFGYRAALLLCGILAASSWLLFAGLGRPDGQPARKAGTAGDTDREVTGPR
jgi:SET family sugar efflux transporter-like MFS transporter